MTATEAALLQQIVTTVVWDGDIASLTPDTRLLEEGILDSPAILELVSFIEDELDVVIDDDEFVAANFESVAALARLVDRKKAVR